jgi:hypothetical protein
MDLSILQYDETARRHVLKLKQGRWAGQAFAVEMSFCRCATCGCADVDWTCKPVDAATPAYTISLDTRERRVSTLPPGVVSAEEQALAEAVVAELLDSDWHALFEEIVSGKRDAIDAVNPMTEETEFPPDVMSGEADMVCFAEVFPYGTFDAIEVGGQHWVVDDTYCVMPGDDTHEVLLSFEPVEDEKAPAPSVFYDYKTGQLGEAVEAPAPGQPSLKELLGALHDPRDMLNLELENRHLKLKACYLQALLDHKGEPYVAPEKVGRNDPCPCGSGKKYKKCCGAPEEV